MYRQYIPLIIALAFITLCFSFFYYLVIYIPRINNERMQYQMEQDQNRALKEAAEKRQSANLECIKFVDSYVQKLDTSESEAIKAGCGWFNICSHEDWMNYMNSNNQDGRNIPDWRSKDTQNALHSACMKKYGY